MRQGDDDFVPARPRSDRGIVSSPLGIAKLEPPRMRAGTVARPSVTARVRRHRKPAVVLVVAPPGYGKTTALVEIAKRGGIPFVWVTVDERDNEPAVFVRWLTAALEGAAGRDEAGDEAQAADLPAQLERLRAVLARSKAVGLAVDDVHLLSAPESLQALEFLADNLPAQSQLALAGRTSPALSLAGAAAESRLTKLGVDDLRFTDEEAAQLLRSAGAAVSDSVAADLNARAEGWPTGLYLAALAHQTTRQPIESFDGSDRFVIDYFDVECLSLLPDEDARFLRETSPLRRLTGSFCDAILGRKGSGAVLERIERQNLFLVREDVGGHKAYRLHSLFREGLLAELHYAEPGRAETVAGRAADWAERRGEEDEAAEYALAAGQRDRFVALVEASAASLWQRGRFAAIRRSLDRLDVPTLEEHLSIAIAGALLHTIEGHDEEADRLAAAAEAGAEPGDAAVALLHATMCRSGVAQMLRDAEVAVAGLPDVSPWRSTALLVLGVARLLLGDHATADSLFGRAESAAGEAAPVTASLALAERAVIAGAAGSWPAADAFALRARELVKDTELDDCPTSGFIYATSARAAVHHSDWIRARGDAEYAHARLQTLNGACPWLAAQTRLQLVRVHLELSEREPAAETFAGLEEILVAGPDLATLDGEIRRLRDEVESSPEQQRAHEQLSAAERRLLPYLTTHLTFREIGELLHVSRNTVKTQAICAYRKLGVSSRSEAIKRSIELGLVDRPEALDTPRRAS